MYNDEPTYCVLWYHMIYDEGAANFTVEPHHAYGPYGPEDAVKMKKMLREQVKVTDSDGLVIEPVITMVPLSWWRV